jgi:cytochrome c biogenesis protein CcmG, thiol:disulfide interchange protein DsbE
MTARQELAAKFTLMGFVLFFVLFFTRPQGQFKAVKLGEQVPNFTLRKDDGQVASLADYRGKILVLNFWASWCGPCVDELPSLKQFAERYNDKGVVVLGVSLDEDPEAYKEFLVKYQINFSTLRNPSHSVSEMYGTFKLPETYIISRDGHLMNKIIGPTDWASKNLLSYIDSLLAAS